MSSFSDKDLFGPSGLSIGACLKEQGVPSVILERPYCYNSLWQRRTYERLKLHLPKNFCQLPKFPFPQHYPSKRQFIESTVSDTQVLLDLCNHDAQPSMVCRSAVHVLTREGKIPVLDIGALEKIRSGEVKIVPGIFNKYFKLEVESLLATGYRSNVSYSLQESDIFSKNGYQKAEFPNKWKGKSGVYRVGFEKRRLGGASALIRKGKNSAHRIRI